MDARDRERRPPHKHADEPAHSAERTTQHPLTRMQRVIGNNAVMRVFVQREDDEEEETLQAKFESDPGPEGGALSASSESAIHSMRGGGSPLDEGVRERMEGALGTSFADVRVHSDSQSAALNRGLSSKAFTTGSDVFLGASASPADDRLLAHELTHVVQQRSMAGSGGGMQVGAAGDAYEQEADAVARKLETHAPAPECD
jgi:hypothetical protein